VVNTRKTIEIKLINPPLEEGFMMTKKCKATGTKSKSSRQQLQY